MAVFPLAIVAATNITGRASPGLIAGGESQATPTTHSSILNGIIGEIVAIETQLGVKTAPASGTVWASIGSATVTSIALNATLGAVAGDGVRGAAGSAVNIADIGSTAVARTGMGLTDYTNHTANGVSSIALLVYGAPRMGAGLTGQGTNGIYVSGWPLSASNTTKIANSTAIATHWDTASFASPAADTIGLLCGINAHVGHIDNGGSNIVTVGAGIITSVNWLTNGGGSNVYRKTVGVLYGGATTGSVLPANDWGVVAGGQHHAFQGDVRIGMPVTFAGGQDDFTTSTPRAAIDATAAAAVSSVGNAVQVLETNSESVVSNPRKVHIQRTVRTTGATTGPTTVTLPAASFTGSTSGGAYIEVLAVIYDASTDNTMAARLKGTWKLGVGTSTPVQVEANASSSMTQWELSAGFLAAPLSMTWANPGFGNIAIQCNGLAGHDLRWSLYMDIYNSI